MTSYNTSLIFELLTEAFDSADLWRLCRDMEDLQPVCAQVNRNAPLNDVADALIAHCQRHRLFDELLDAVARARPRQFERFASRLSQGHDRSVQQNLSMVVRCGDNTGDAVAYHAEAAEGPGLQSGPTGRVLVRKPVSRPSHSPYSTGGIIKDPTMFFGREEELRRIRDRLRKGDSTAIVGLRRIGKSSLLYQLANQTDALPEGVVVTYLDLQDGAHHRPMTLLNAALHCLDEKLNHRYSFALVNSLAEFSSAIKQIAISGFQPVICFDEVEDLTRRDAFNDDFFECLRSLGSQRILAFVTASCESLDILLKRKQRTSPFYNIFVNLELAGLTDEAARALLTRPFQVAGLGIPPDECMDQVLDLAGHYPFYLQMAAHHLFEARREKGAWDFQALRQAFTRDAERHFHGLWRHLSPDEQAGVKRLAGMAAVLPDWERTCEALIHCGLAEGSTQAPHLFSTVLAEMLKAGEIERDRTVRPLSSLSHITPKEKQAMPLLVAYATIALAAAAISLVIALLLPLDKFWPSFVILTLALAFILFLADRLTGDHFLNWLSHLLER